MPAEFQDPAIGRRRRRGWESVRPASCECSRPRPAQQAAASSLGSRGGRRGACRTRPWCPSR
eukprot:scaffold6941_cov214-Pinguiococcus_pyrenoidosus.AAC.3